ncbi:DUF4352 domain-containing protein [Bacillus alkalicellulosilyticus]|uniref:DUF4352 domain-containing protein n=1 Tax=Alkalihalobacterium alkalicellulosilyticum TaxID=1912214 RepID=UPI0014828A90|nr:DUF4352 domain-containing protein [Bacillus alkalicellulosilyticus]
MKRFLFLVSILVLSVVVGCSNGDTNDVPGNQEQEKSGTENIEVNNEQIEDEDISNENADNKESSGNGKAEDATLKLGETGFMKSPIGEYEITVHNVRLVDKVGDYPPLTDSFFVFNVSITNIGDNTISGSDVVISDLFNEEDRKSGSLILEEINVIDEDIEPGETVEGEILFDQSFSDSYSLIFGYAIITSNELTWNFSFDEIDK